jgi:uncharacterized membrane protein
MKTNQEYKNQALTALRGNWAPAVVCAIVFMFATCVIISPSYCANMASFGMAPFVNMSPAVLKGFTYSGLLINFFLLYPLMLGYTVAHNDLLVNGDSRLTGNAFRHMLKGYFRNVWSMFLVYLFAFLWALLLIIPGIIKALAYSMTPFIIKDYPELSANQAINLSIKMMKGRKFDLFWLCLSFIGWIILCMFTLGIGYVWLAPYIQTSMAAFYQDVKNDYITKNIN